MFVKGDTTGKSEAGKKGAARTAEIRRRRRSLREAAQALMWHELTITEQDAADKLREMGVDDPLGADAIMLAQFVRACAGDTEAARFVRDTAGEKPGTEVSVRALADRLGYSEYYTSRRFRALAGMTLRDYLRLRRLAFALRDVRDTDAGILDIAVQYGFSSNEAFTHAFKKAYGVSPSAYRAAPGPVVLQTILRPFDCYLMEGANHMNETQNAGEVQTYFVHIPAHKFLHIRNYESIGYWDFWQRQSAIPGQDCETICGLLASIPGKLDDAGGTGEDAGSGQLMAWINEPTGRICSWGIPLAEAYGVRLSADYAGPVPAQMQLMDVPAGEYLVFEHGPFDFETQNAAVEAKVEQTMRDFDYAASGYRLDLTPDRVFYFYHDCARFFKYVRPVCRA